jgi:uncharacterized membrane protein (DUF2068 family)
MSKAESRKAHSGAANQSERADRGVMTIGFLKVAKGLLLTATALGAASLLDDSMRETAAGWMDTIQVDSKSRLVQAALSKLAFIDKASLENLTAGTFFYAILSLTEGVGLLLRKQWAHYLTVIATASLIPIEIFQLIKKFTALRVIVMAVNIAVVVYLVYRLKEKHARRRAQ